MITKIYTSLCNVSPWFTKVTRKYMYQFLAQQYQKKDWTFMNYGYTPLAPDTDKPQLDPEDEINRYCIQLYHHVASTVDLQGLDVLEVGSGRGGGAHYIKNYLKPRTMMGVDFSEKAVALCNRYFKVDGLTYKHGDAEDLPFEDESFDAVINVESSHCYSSMETFLAQVKRVLKPGGHFLFADFRPHEKVALLKQRLEQTGMQIVKQQNITANVLSALDLDHTHRIEQIRAGSPKLLAGFVKEFAGTKGAQIYNQFKDETTVYQSFVLKKV